MNIEVASRIHDVMLGVYHDIKINNDNGSDKCFVTIGNNVLIDSDFNIVYKSHGDFGVMDDQNFWMKHETTDENIYTRYSIKENMLYDSEGSSNPRLGIDRYNSMSAKYENKKYDVTMFNIASLIMDVITF